MAEQTPQADPEQQDQTHQELTIPELHHAILRLNPLEFAELWTWLSDLAARKLRQTFLGMDKERQQSYYGFCVDPESVSEESKDAEETNLEGQP